MCFCANSPFSLYKCGIIWDRIQTNEERTNKITLYPGVQGLGNNIIGGFFFSSIVTFPFQYYTSYNKNWFLRKSFCQTCIDISLNVQRRDKKKTKDYGMYSRKRSRYGTSKHSNTIWWIKCFLIFDYVCWWTLF